MKALGESPLQPERRPKRGTRKALDRMQDQARVQLIARHQGKPYYETLEVTSEEGLSRLPELDEGDVFFDIEGDAFVGEGGLEYQDRFPFFQSDQRGGNGVRTTSALQVKTAASPTAGPGCPGRRYPRRSPSF